ncbi:hypothetical protein PSTG_08498 [Puccinia striiformis f. sp. tritici PST-78]|uniref:Uncharacterized protein n=1 Tax=Puccinia striiformis f. sp. tritici PST-78 TaxID=1165861 RepID=A0A0L0VGT2_9BASI|nr:hypothetical protein PSTG_08498 [Puccinia striiformis f. sp. tritici PST-78]
MDDSGWVDGVRYELNPDGLSMTQRICLYKANYKKCLKLKGSTKVISAEIYNSGKVFLMVAEYSRTKTPSGTCRQVLGVGAACNM